MELGRHALPLLTTRTQVCTRQQPSPEEDTGQSCQAGQTPGTASSAHPSAPLLQKPGTSMKPDMAGVLRLLLMLLAAVPTGTWAHPVSTTTSVPPDAKDCHMAQFKSLSPQELQAFETAKDAIEERLVEKDKCGSNLLPRAWALQQLQVQERPKVLQAELALTLKVLENVAEPALRTLLDQPLHTLRHIRSQLRACIPAPPTADPKPQSRRLSRWLHRLHEAQKKETPGCLQASVTFNLYHLLNRDLRCVASGDQCV